MNQTASWNVPSLFPASMRAPAQKIAYWESGRRAEILNLFAEREYGRTPSRRPDRTETEILSENPRAQGGKNRSRKLRLHMAYGARSVALEIWMYFPHGDGPFPVQMMIDPFEGELHAKEPPEYLYSFFPSDQITDRGYIAVKALVSTVCPDSRERFRSGILDILSGEEEGVAPESRWGAIGAWAWAGSRCADYLFTLPEVRADEIAVSGCSRAGKAALWCGAQDPRIGVVMSNVSGTSGAALTRGKIGEHVADITQNFPFWFCPAYAAFAGREDDLPFDQHMLLALAAPRPLYLASASQDAWADPEAEYRSLLLASEVYRAYASETRLPNAMPSPDSPVRSGKIGYHLRAGTHDLTPYDWTNYLDFCDGCFQK